MVRAGCCTWCPYSTIHTFLSSFLNNLLIYISLSYQLNISPFNFHCHLWHALFTCCTVHFSRVGINYHYLFHLSMISVLSKGSNVSGKPSLFLFLCCQVVNLMTHDESSFPSLEKGRKSEMEGLSPVMWDLFSSHDVISVSRFVFADKTVLCFLSVEFANLNHTLRNIECWL